jgi:hypothetical protein
MLLCWMQEINSNHVTLLKFWTKFNERIKCWTYYAEWHVSLVTGHDWLTDEILFILFFSIRLDIMRTSIKADAYQGLDTLGEGRIRINIVANDTDTIISHLVWAMNSTNEIIRYAYFWKGLQFEQHHCKYLVISYHFFIHFVCVYINRYVLLIVFYLNDVHEYTYERHYVYKLHVDAYLEMRHVHMNIVPTG